MSDEIGAVEGHCEQTVELRLVRCGCGHPWTHKGQTCPTPKEIVDIDPQLIITNDTQIGA